MAKLETIRKIGKKEIQSINKPFDEMSSKADEILDLYIKDNEYKIIYGTLHEVEEQMNELHNSVPQYEAYLFTKIDDEYIIIMKIQP